jgi:hypothetical protein
MKQKPSSRRRRSSTKSILRLPDMERAKAAVLNSLNSADAKRGYRHAIDEFVDCIALNRAWPSTGSWSCVIALISNPALLKECREMLECLGPLGIAIRV